MILPAPTPQYDQTNEAETRRGIANADKQNMKTGQILDKLLFRDTATGAVKTVVITSGAFVIS